MESGKLFHQPPALKSFYGSLFWGLLDTLAPIYHEWVVKVLHTEGLQTWDYNHRSSHHHAVVCLFSLTYSELAANSESMNSLSSKHRKASVERWKYWQSRRITTKADREWWFVCFHSDATLWRVSNAGHMFVPNDKLNPWTTSNTTEPRTKYDKWRMKKWHRASSIGFHPMHRNKNGRSLAVRFVVTDTAPITLSKPVVHAQRN